jgi:TfoX/Sxy family transcriptional regulator of competence genes
MAYDEGLAQRVREEMEELSGYTEKTMFGGVGFMLYGNMANGVIGEDLIVRVGKEQYERALAEPQARPFDMTGRPMTGWVLVTEAAYASGEDLRAWVRRGVDTARALPAK